MEGRDQRTVLEEGMMGKDYLLRLQNMRTEETVLGLKILSKYPWSYEKEPEGR